MDTVKLKPAVKSYIWGGTNLKKYGKESKEDVISETWELSFHDDGLSLVDSGIYKGKTLKEVSMFVSTKLSTLEAVAGTATHFVLKKYRFHEITKKIPIAE